MEYFLVTDRPDTEQRTQTSHRKPIENNRKAMNLDGINGMCPSDGPAGSPAAHRHLIENQ